MLVTCISAHATARNLHPQIADQLEAALAELGLGEPLPGRSATPSSGPDGATV
jgi:hypothetical protein